MSWSPQQWSTSLHEVLNENNQRVIVDCAGDLAWSQQCIDLLSQNKQSLIISEQFQSSSIPVIPFKKTTQLLGQEYQVVIYDAHFGFDVEAFTRIIGLIESPGILLFLRPINWQNLVDPKNTWQNEKEGHPFFIQYFLKQLESPGVISCHQNELLKPINALPKSLKTKINSELGLTQQQKSAWDILNTIFNDELFSIALIASRGRGKSSLIGKWLNFNKDSNKTFIITSDSKKAVGHCLTWNTDNNNVEYKAVDNLLNNEYVADCVIVDEAATIPIAQLLDIKQRFQHVIYTSTLEGYEGTGQGLELQFLSTFEKSNLKIIEMTAPIRWGQADVLEEWTKQTLLLDQTSHLITPTDQFIDYKRISQKQLSDEPSLLKEVFLLLQDAHYRTKPSDLRMLMDNPDVTLFVAQIASNIVGVLLLIEEGSMDKALSHEIYFGRRRPLGHLLAQTLTAQAGCEGFTQLKGYRIQRIAVAKNFRRKHIGSQLIQQAHVFAKKLNADYIGANFALDEERLNFWQANNMSLVHIGVGQGTSTGKPSLSMLNTLSQQANDYKKFCLNNLKQNFSEQLLTQFKTMKSKHVIALLKVLPNIGEDRLNASDSYLNGYKGFDYALADLRQSVFYILQKSINDLSQVEQTILVKAVLQYHSWTQLITDIECSGKKELNQKLKEIIKRSI